MELDGETVNVDLRENDMDGEGEGCSSGTGGLALAKGTSGGNEAGECEDSGISVRECGNEGQDKSCGGPRSGFDLWTLGEQFGFCDVEVGVLINAFEVLGVSTAGHADGLLLEDDAVKKITQITIISYFCKHAVAPFFH